MSDAPQSEQRRDSRVDVALQVKLRFADLERLRIFTTKDLSAGGIFVVSETPKAVGSIVQVVLYPPGIELGLPIQGSVVRVVTPEDAAQNGGRPGMGVRFDDLDEEGRESLIALMTTVVRAFEEADAKEPEPVPRPREPGEISAEAEENVGDDDLTIMAPTMAAHGGAQPSRPPTRPIPRAGSIERRAADRFPARTIVRLRFHDAQHFRDFYTKDVSRGGVFVSAPQPLAVGSEVDLELVLPTGDELALEGRVARTVMPGADTPADNVGMGIEFINLTLEKRAEITRHVEELTSRKAGERLGRVRPVASAVVRYDSPADLQRVVRGDLRHKRIFVASEDVRPVGTPIVVQLQAPQLPDGIQLQGEVEQLIERGDLERGGGRPGMVVRLVDLTDEILADLDLRVRPAPAVNPVAAAKASKLADAAQEDLKAGKRASAIANLRLALSFDPRNAGHKKLLDELVAQLPPKPTPK